MPNASKIMPRCRDAAIVCNRLALVGADTAGLKSLFQKSPLKSRAVHGATICDVILPINT